jgi:hypothetical protein
MNLVSLLILPAIIGMSSIDETTNIASPNGASFVVAGVALVVLIASVAYSKRPSAGFGERPDATDATDAPVATPVSAAD